MPATSRCLLFIERTRPPACDDVYGEPRFEGHAAAHRRRVCGMGREDVALRLRRAASGWPRANKASDREVVAIVPPAWRGPRGQMAAPFQLLSALTRVLDAAQPSHDIAKAGRVSKRGRRGHVTRRSQSAKNTVLTMSSGQRNGNMRLISEARGSAGTN